MNLLDEFKNVANKLKKTQRVVFKKQDTKELAGEFNQLALKFDKQSSNLLDYGGLCLLGVAKCDADGQRNALMKGARIFRKSKENRDKLGCIYNNSSIEGAYRCYSQALSSEQDPVMKACIIREFKEINKNLSLTSDFNSNPHRIYELEIASNNDIISHDYISALEKLTDIIEDISERKCEHLYADVLKRIEITRILLLIILELPANRQSPSHVKILEKLSWNVENFSLENSYFVKIEDENLVLLFETLIHLCKNRQYASIKEICDEISDHHSTTLEQKLLIENILRKYSAFN